MEKVFVIGIDSASLWIIRELSAKYKMKGFNEFIRNGTLMDLESTIPPLTPVAWPSIYSGAGPEKHGVTNFFKLNRDYSKELIGYNAEKNRPFWDTLSEKGIRSLVITPAMVTEASKKDNVDMITGFPLKPKFSSPKLLETAKSAGFEGEPEIEAAIRDGAISLEEASSEYASSIHSRAELAKALDIRGEYDLIFVCFTETDRMQHYSLGSNGWQKHVAPLYEEISSFIEWILSRYGKESQLLLVSDHGAQPIRKKFLVNEWLIKNNYAAMLSSGKGSNSNGEQMQVTSKKPVIRFICASAVDSDYEEFKVRREMDMGKTAAFASLTNNPFGSIWVNDSRFSRPVVASREKGKLLSNLKSALLSIKTEDGKNLVTAIYEDHLSPKDQISPDLVFEVREGYTIDISGYSDSLFSEPELARSGDHTRQGIFGAYPKLNKEYKEIKVTDISGIISGFFNVKSA